VPYKLKAAGNSGTKPAIAGFQRPKEASFWVIHKFQLPGQSMNTPCLLFLTSELLMHSPVNGFYRLAEWAFQIDETVGFRETSVRPAAV
jgi:hypothetical protein